jgi:MFS family permease
MIPDLVPREQIPSASALESININIARAIGPAIAGVFIERAGVAAVFALNTLAFFLFGLVVIFSHPAKRTISRFPEQFTSALRAGEYYVRYSPVVRRIILRLGLFLMPASILWAELPLVATHRLGLGANGYGLLLGALGVGAIAGAFSLPRLRASFSNNGLLLAASLLYAIALIALVLIPNTAAILVLLIPTGIAWVAVLSNMNTELQLFLPGWVRARSLSIYQMVLFGAQAAGAVIWGLVAGQIGLDETFLIAAATMALGALTLRFWPLLNVQGEDRNLAVYWPEPRMALHPEPEGGPVLIMTTYTITPEKEPAFFEAMSFVRRSRLRTGAVQWGLYRDGEQPNQLVEFFVVPSWEEHLRQHTERLTGTDRQFEEQADALSNPPSHSVHLIGVDMTNEQSIGRE